MRIECNIDYVDISEDLNSQMPLSQLIREVFSTDVHYCFSNCDDSKCMKCLVYIDGMGVLPSCLVPVFTINGKKIVTQDAYMNTEIAQDVQSAFKILKVNPCPDCYKSKVMLFGFIVEKILERENIVKQEGDLFGNEPAIRDNIIDSSLRLTNCHCMLKSDMYSVIDKTLKIRRNHLA